MDPSPEELSKRKRKKDGGSDSDPDSDDPKRFKQQILAAMREEDGEGSVPKSAGIDDDNGLLSSVKVSLSPMEKNEKGGEGSDACENKKQPSSRVMTNELWKEYKRQVKESEGFDVDDLPASAGGRVLRPLHIPMDDSLCIEAAQRAINRHNRKKKDGPIELVRVVKIITMIRPWTLFYITLEGRDTADGQIKTYQALVISVTGMGFACSMFRLKPAEGTQSDKVVRHPLYSCGGCQEDQELESESDIPSPTGKKPKIDWGYEEDFDFKEEKSTIDEQLEDEQAESDDGEVEEEQDDDNGSDHPEEEDDSDGQIGSDNQADGGNNQDYDGLFEVDDKDCIPDEKFTLEDMEAYYEQLEESQGFDITYFPEMETLCFITPLFPPWDESITKHANVAIDFLNKEGGQYKLKEILKVNEQATCCCSHLYITFVAIEGDDGERKTFQARMLSTHGREKVEEIRLKP